VNRISRGTHPRDICAYTQAEFDHDHLAAEGRRVPSADGQGRTPFQLARSCTRGHDTMLAGLMIGSRSFCMQCLVEAFDKLGVSEVTRVEA